MSTLDHIILKVNDLEQSVFFYTEVMGFENIGQDGPFTVVRVSDTFQIQLAPWSTDGYEHYAFALSRVHFDAVFNRVRSNRIEYGPSFHEVGTNEGPGEETGARGPAPTLYFNDPNNPIELCRRTTMGMAIGPLHVRRSILIEAPPSRVWKEFESSDQIKAWLNLGHVVHQFEPNIGGEVEMSVEIDGVQRYYGGRVLVVEAERELSFESQWRKPHNWPVATFWTIRLTALYGGTLVEIFHHGFERLGSEAAENLQGYEDGWDIKHLKALRTIVDG